MIKFARLAQWPSLTLAHHLQPPLRGCSDVTHAWVMWISGCIVALCAAAGCTVELPQPVVTDLTEAPDPASDSGSDLTATTQSHGDTDTPNDTDTTALDTSQDSGGGNEDAHVPPVDGSDTGSGPGTEPSGPIGTDAGPCGAGETLCGATCVPVGECECGGPCTLPNATAECRAGECAVVACETGFVDCDGEAANGCEVLFSSDEEVPQPVQVPLLSFQMSVEEMSQRDWEGIRRFPLEETCSSCERNSRPPGVPAIEPASNRDILPASTDFRATAAVAWNIAGIWLNVVIQDDTFIGAEDFQWSDDDPADARLFDNFMIVWDNEAGESSAGSGSDRVLFVGVDGTLKDWREQSLRGVTVSVQPQAQCRVLNLRMSGDYLVGSGGSEPINFSAGNEHGLAFAYNDFDWTSPAMESVARQSLVFGLPMQLSPGDYFEGDRTLPQIELISE